MSPKPSASNLAPQALSNWVLQGVPVAIPHQGAPASAALAINF
jgi:hypothetical protein